MRKVLTTIFWVLGMACITPGLKNRRARLRMRTVDDFVPRFNWFGRILTGSQAFSMACLILLHLVASAHAAFTPRGVIANVMLNGQAPTCGQFIRWYNHHSDKDRGTLGYWILGFYTGVETQMVDEPAFANSTGVELHDPQILELTRGFCKDNLKALMLDAIVSFVQFGLEESVKHPHPGYKHGPNIHGQIVYGKTCQNLIMDTSGETEVEGRKWLGPIDSDHKYFLEEWMLGAASGIELMVLHNNPIQGTKIEPDALLAQFYQLCRDNPTWMIIQAVMVQELANIKATKEGAK